MLKTLISTELKPFKTAGTVRQILFISLAIVIPFAFMSGSLLDGMNVGEMSPFLKAQIFESFDNIFYYRVSLSFFLFISWIFIPKVFYGKKINGEIEAIISVGYSARQLWWGKSIATMIAAFVSALPLVIAYLVTYKIYIYFKYGFIAFFNPLGFLFLFIINPVLIFGIILIIGCVQLVTDDYMKSSFALFIIAFGNVFTLSLLRNLHEPGTKMLFLFVSLGLITALMISSAVMSRKVLNENLIVSLHKTNAKLYKLMKAVREK